MIANIGTLSRGIPQLSRLAAGWIKQHGPAAVFLSLDANRLVAMTRDDPDFDRGVDHNRAYVVGTYTADHTVYRLAQMIERDARHYRHEEMAA